MTSILLMITIALCGVNVGIIAQALHFTSHEALLILLGLGGILCVSLYHLLVRLKPCAGVPMGVSLALTAANATVAGTLHDPASQRVRARVAATIPQQPDKPTVTDEDVTAVHPAVPPRRGR